MEPTVEEELGGLSHKLSELCRICAQPSNVMIEIFGESGVADMIRQHLSIIVSLACESQMCYTLHTLYQKICTYTYMYITTMICPVYDII